MTKSDLSASSLLTEEAYARSKGAATIPRDPGDSPREWDYLTFEQKYRTPKWQQAVLDLGSEGWSRYMLDFSLWESASNRYFEWKDEYLAWRKKEYAKLRRNNAAGENQHELGPREFTFTYSPEWYDEDVDAQRAMEIAVEKLTRYYKDEIIEFHAVGEFTRDGRAHVHGWYHLDGGRKITDKNFKRAWKHWNPKRKLGKGFEGGHHATIQRTSDFSGYVEKHLEEAWLKVDINNGNEGKEGFDASTP